MTFSRKRLVVVRLGDWVIGLLLFLLLFLLLLEEFVFDDFIFFLIFCDGFFFPLNDLVVFLVFGHFLIPL